MWIVYVVLVLGVILGISIIVTNNVKKQITRQQKEAITEWNRRVDTLCSVTEVAAVQNLDISGKTLREAGIWFDISRRELRLPDVFWSLENRNIARTLITCFKFFVKTNMNNTEPEDSDGNQQIIDTCIQGLMNVLTYRAEIDPKQTLEVLNLINSPGKSAEDSIRSLLSTKRAPK